MEGMSVLPFPPFFHFFLPFSSFFVKSVPFSLNRYYTYLTPNAYLNPFHLTPTGSSRIKSTQFIPFHCVKNPRSYGLTSSGKVANTLIKYEFFG